MVVKVYPEDGELIGSIARHGAYFERKFKCNRSLCERDRLIRQITRRAPAMSNLLLIVFYRMPRLSVYAVYSRRTSSATCSPQNENVLNVERCCLHECLLKREAKSSPARTRKNLKVSHIIVSLTNIVISISDSCKLILSIFLV